MIKNIDITEPYTSEVFEKLRAGDRVLLTGRVVVMRDSAQRRLLSLCEGGSNLPLNLKGTVVFYAGPAKEMAGAPIGAIGPTTSARMDKYLKFLYQQGVMATIGKGDRSELVEILNKEYRRVYFVAPSGVAAFLASRVERSEVVAFEDLGPEAIRLIEVHDFPLFVWIDAFGRKYRHP